MCKNDFVRLVEFTAILVSKYELLTAVFAEHVLVTIFLCQIIQQRCMNDILKLYVYYTAWLRYGSVSTNILPDNKIALFIYSVAGPFRHVRNATDTGTTEGWSMRFKRDRSHYPSPTSTWRSVPHSPCAFCFKQFDMIIKSATSETKYGER